MQKYRGAYTPGLVTWSVQSDTPAGAGAPPVSSSLFMGGKTLVDSSLHGITVAGPRTFQERAAYE